MADEKEQKEQEDQTEALKQVAKRLSQSTDNQVAEMAQMKQQINVMKEIANAVMDIRQIMALQALSAKRAISAPEPTEKPPSEEPKPDTRVELEEIGTFKEVVTAIAGAVAGLTAGIVAGIAGFAARLSKMFLSPKQIESITKAWNGVVTTATKFFTKIRTAVTSTLGALTKPFEALKAASKESKIGQLLKSFSKGFDALLAPIKTATAPLKIAIKEAGVLGKVFKGFFNFFKPLGKVLGKAFGPIIIGFNVIKDAFKIFGDESKSLSDKIIEVLAAIPKQIGSFFLEIPDMIKNGVSFLAKKLFGDDNPLTKFLDGFSFVDMWEATVDKVTEFFKSPVESFKAMIKVADESIHAAIMWAKDLDFSELLMKAWEKITDIGNKVKDSVSNGIKSAVEYVGSIDLWGLIQKGFEKIMNIGTNVSNAISDGVQSALNWITDIDLMTPITNFLNNFNGIDDIIAAPVNLIKDGVAWVLKKIGFDLVSDDLKSADIGGFVAKIVFAPYHLLQSAVNWVMSKIGFGEGGEGDVSGLETEGDGILKTILKIVTAPARLLGKAVDSVLGMLGFDKLQSFIPSLDDVLKSAGEFLSGIVSSAIDFVKSKLAFWKKDEEAEEAKRQAKEAEQRNKERRALAEKTGIVKKEGGVLGFGATNVIDDATLKGLDDGQLETLMKAYAEDSDLLPVLAAEVERRKTARKQAIKTPGTIQSAIQPQAVAAFEQSYANPAVIGGLGQESVAQAEEMALRQEALNQSRTRQSTGEMGPVIAAPTNVSNVTNNSTVINEAMPSTRDNTDEFFFLKATGNR